MYRLTKCRDYNYHYIDRGLDVTNTPRVQMLETKLILFLIRYSFFCYINRLVQSVQVYQNT